MSIRYTLYAGAEKAIKTTRYFEEQVLRKRVLARPLKRETQPDGRIRFWGIVPELGGRVLRVVTLDDGETVHNAFPDRNFVIPGEGVEGAP